MLILGHMGITFGVALAANSLSSRARAKTEHVRTPCARVRDSIASLSKKFDLRLLLLGSLLPDIVDKSVGMVLFPEVFGTGRLFCHALVFPFGLAIAGTWLYRSRQSTALIMLAYGAAMHLTLDAMWRTPSILLWPFAGPLLRGVDAHGWLTTLLATLLTNSSVFVPEIAGGVLLLPLAREVAQNVGLIPFLRTGAAD
jgi:inner membrane protein